MEFLGTLLVAVALGLVWGLIRLVARATWNKVTEPKDTLRKVERDARQQSRAADLSQREAEHYQDQQKLGVCFARFALAVAAADGSVDQAELSSVFAFFHDAHPSYMAHIRDVLSRDSKDPSRIDWNYNSLVANELLAKDRFKGFDGVIFDGLLGIAAADGQVHDTELSAIYGIMRSLGWSEEKIATCFRSRFGWTDTVESENDADALEQAYHVLDLPKTASMDDVRRRFRELAKTHHPDTVSVMGDGVQRAANEDFQRIKQAYDIITSHAS